MNRHTDRAYSAAQTAFLTWCKRKKVRFPASPGKIALYLADALTRFSSATVSVHLSAIAKLYRDKGIALDTKDKDINIIMARSREEARDKRRAATVIVAGSMGEVGQHALVFKGSAAQQRSKIASNAALARWSKSQPARPDISTLVDEVAYQQDDPVALRRIIRELEAERASLLARLRTERSVEREKIVHWLEERALEPGHARTPTDRIEDEGRADGLLNAARSLLAFGDDL